MLTADECHKPTPTRPALTALCVALLISACGGADDATTPERAAALADEPETATIADDEGKVDLGASAAASAPRSGAREQRQDSSGTTPAAAQPNGGAEAHLKGAFGPAFNWPVIPIHQVLLADGRVMSYGSDFAGKGSAQLNYVVWDPVGGTAPEAFMVLDNATRTDIFCGTQLLMPDTGEVMLLGGTRKDEWKRSKYGTADVTWFSPSANLIRKGDQSMASRRWYATAVTTGEGEQVVLGGRDTPVYAAAGESAATLDIYSPIPEVYSPSTGWRALHTASSDEAYGAKYVSWSYPRAWLAPNGHIFLLNRAGFMYDLDPAGSGLVSKYLARTSQSVQLPSLMFAPGKILSLRTGSTAVVVDLNGSAPTVAATSPLSQVRQYANATVLADGKVFVNGGSSSGNVLEGAVFHSETWDPHTGAWSLGAVASKPRLYHATAMLLPDGTVLTGGGGRPGPVRNLNAEIYYPPYLFKPDGSGEAAARPEILGAPTQQLGWAEPFSVEVSPDAVISQVRLIRTGSVTHAFNNEQRAMTLPFTQSGGTLLLQTPAERAVAPPGFYLLFVVAADGVPSVARIVKLNTAR